jgi:hypothetical protein
MQHEVTVIKGRRFPTCRHCTGIAFELAHAGKHVREIEEFHFGENGDPVAMMQNTATAPDSPTIAGAKLIVRIMARRKRATSEAELSVILLTSPLVVEFSGGPAVCCGVVEVAIGPVG